MIGNAGSALSQASVLVSLFFKNFTSKFHHHCEATFDILLQKHHKYKQAAIRSQSFNLCACVCCQGVLSGVTYIDLEWHVIYFLIFWCDLCEDVHSQWKTNQADLLCVFGFNLLCMLYMHYHAASLHIKDTGIAGNVTGFRGVAICYNLESLMMVRVPFPFMLGEASCDVTFFFW